MHKAGQPYVFSSEKFESLQSFLREKKKDLELKVRRSQSNTFLLFFMRDIFSLFVVRILWMARNGLLCSQHTKRSWQVELMLNHRLLSRSEKCHKRMPFPKLKTVKKFWQTLFFVLDFWVDWKLWNFANGCDQVCSIIIQHQKKVEGKHPIRNLWHLWHLKAVDCSLQRSMSTSSSSRKSGVKVKIEEVFNVKYAEPPKPSAPPPKRRSHMPFVPFRKERFLQANYRFKVIVGSDYSAQLEKADQLVDWDKVEQVSFYTINDYNCPICLENCIAP